MLKQIEGSQAVAEAVAMCRPEVIAVLQDYYDAARGARSAEPLEEAESQPKP